jgi:DNA-directed RNA polymerase subunit H (RpoH/RPB5)
MRGFDTSEYPPLTLEFIEKSQSAQRFATPHSSPEAPHLGPIPPIVVSASKTPHSPASPASTEQTHMHTHSTKRPAPFQEGSIEYEQLERVLQQLGRGAVPEFLSGFRKRFPVLACVVDELADEHTRSGVITNNTQESAKDTIRLLRKLYQSLAEPVAEVHFHQCFNPENLWGANVRDQKFMAEMNTMIANMEDVASSLVTQQVPSLLTTLTPDKWTDLEDALREELASVFKRNHTVIFGFRTRNKASETLDLKYEARCHELMAKHGVFVQLFNLKKLMFNPTKHEIVPDHIPLDMWRDRDEIERIKRTFNVQNPSKEFSIIPLSDPVAKFVGLRRGQLCRIPRVNDTGGTYYDYRWCK